MRSARNTEAVHYSTPAPTSDDWRQYGVSEVVELDAGKQSRVFSALVEGERAVVKLTDARLTDRVVLATRMLVAEQLARLLECVAPPIRIEGEFVRPIADWLMTATRFVEGAHPDITDPAHARAMGSTLARLHEVMAEVPPSALPPARALADEGVSPGDWQLLHGDFSNQNILRTSAGMQVLDFDDCGYGPVEYDLGNSLYMVKFDAFVRQSQEPYEVFRPEFLAGYAQRAGSAVDDRAVDEMIHLRTRALRRWLADPASAPIGVRTASPQWLETLGAFVNGLTLDLAED